MDLKQVETIKLVGRFSAAFGPVTGWVNPREDRGMDAIAAAIVESYSERQTPLLTQRTPCGVISSSDTGGPTFSGVAAICVSIIILNVAIASRLRAGIRACFGNDLSIASCSP